MKKEPNKACALKKTARFNFTTPKSNRWLLNIAVVFRVKVKQAGIERIDLYYCYSHVLYRETGKKISPDQEVGSLWRVLFHFHTREKWKRNTDTKNKPILDTESIYFPTYIKHTTQKAHASRK